MATGRRRTTGIVIAASAAAMVLAATALPRARGEEPPPGPPPGAAGPAALAPPPPGAPPDCRSCHAGHGDSLDAGGHGVLTLSLGTSPAACHACHGDLDAHARDGTAATARRFDAGGAAAVAEACARCHRAHPDHAVSWGLTPWAGEGKTCLSCHVVHGAARGRLDLPAAAGRIGEDGCRTCHAPVVEAGAAMLHDAAAAALDGGACEACHGPGADHARRASGRRRGPDADAAPIGGEGFVARPARDACVRCHARAPETHAARRSAWERPDLDCTACHRGHATVEDARRARAATPPRSARDLAVAGATAAGDAACARCHDASAASFAGSAHALARHRGTGAPLRCEDCHGPASMHAADGNPRTILRPRTLDRAAVTALCLVCHGDGPEHAVRFDASTHGEGGRTCLSCHAVHAPAADRAAPAFANMAEARAASPPAADAGACAACHPDPHPVPATAPHAALVRGGAASCESCHGPGGRHVATRGRAAFILRPDRLEPRAADAICLGCHGETATAASWARHHHGRGGVRCADCHDAVARDGSATRAAGPALCLGCHREQEAAFRLPHAHAASSGAPRCTDCHDPHRAPPAARAAAAASEACARCHRAEATARLHPHEGDRGEGCLSCHVAHGTTAPRLLRFDTARELCLSCHVPPPSHDARPAGSHGACVRCHIAVHGSDADRTLLR